VMSRACVVRKLCFITKTREKLTRILFIERRYADEYERWYHEEFDHKKSA
jgi:hypothetical protein